MYNHINNIGLSSKDEKKEEEFDSNYLDGTLIQAIQADNVEFIEGLEKFLTEFIEDESKFFFNLEKKKNLINLTNFKEKSYTRCVTALA